MSRLAYKSSLQKYEIEIKILSPIDFRELIANSNTETPLFFLEKLLNFTC